MSDKAIKKKQLILKKSRDVFAAKGYRSVTMKDLVEACGISRGGLYLYFDNVEAVFLGVIGYEGSKADPAIREQIPENPKTVDYLSLFIMEQKKDILRGEDSLLAAMYEYSFEKNQDKTFEGKTVIGDQFEKGMSFLISLFQKGRERGEISCDDPESTALNIMITFEGMRSLSRCMSLPEEYINKEISTLLSPLLPKTR